jgi:hypothetical protein
MAKKTCLSIVLFFFILFQCVNARAQQIPAADLEAIQNEITNLYSKKMETALAKDQAKANKMKADLQDVEKQPDNEGRKRALENFSKAHKAHYKKTMDEAGLNMQDILAKLKNRFPGYDFSVANDFGIAVSSKNQNIGNGFLQQHPQQEDWAYQSFNKSGGPQIDLDTYSTTNEITSLTSIQELTFTPNKTVNCAVASGGSVVINNRYIQANSTGVIAGGCTSLGNLSSRTIIPNGQSITGRVAVSLEVNCWALGIGGTSAAQGESSFSLRCEETNQWFGSGYKSLLALAPIFWYASLYDAGNFSFSPSLNGLQGKTFSVYVGVRSFAISGACCATNSFAKANITTARIEY